MSSDLALKVSVAMCTYNGARHLLTQLESVAAQTCPPVELVVCDDASQDATVEIVRDFAKSASFPVNLVVNRRNLGVAQNFGQAISLARGDVVVLCDQDDVWESWKVERFVELFSNDPAAEAVFTNAWIADDNLNLTGQDLWHYHQVNRLETSSGSAQLLQTLLAGNIVFGTTLAIRTSAKAFFLPIPEHLPTPMIHDGWIASVLASRGTLRGVNEKLTLYRQHSQQQVGVGSHEANGILQRLRRSGQARRNALGKQLAYTEGICRLLSQRKVVTPQELEPTLDWARHLRIRATLPARRWKRLYPIWEELIHLRYQKYTGRTLIPALRDLLL